MSKKNKNIIYDPSEVDKSAKEFIIAIGERLRDERIKKGINQMEMGFHLKVDQNYISRVECGKINIKLENLYKFLHYLDLSLKL